MDNSFGLIVIIAVLLAAFGIVLFVNKKFTELKTEKVDDKSLLLLQQQINQISENINQTNTVITNTIKDQFRSSAEIIKNVTEKLTILEGTNKQVVSITEQLQGLENILNNPKQRGILGEYYLESLLENLFPPGQYQMQYPFANGDAVDAALFIKDKIIPIDSKFSLENYNKILEEKDEHRKEVLQKAFKQDLKNRVDETAKYIRPKEGTMDFAFMFIPSEAIYYDLLVNQVGAIKVNTRSLLEYAFKDKKVIIVSPTSFAAYLQTVLQGLRSLAIEESIKDVMKNVSNLGKHLLSYETYMKKLGSNLGTTVNMYNNAYKEFNKIDKDILKVTGESIDTEILQLEKPKTEYSEN
jgi:DNA recombination protein RmuC